MLLVQDNKILVDIAVLRNFIEELCKYLGIDAAILFTGPEPFAKGRIEEFFGYNIDKQSND